MATKGAAATRSGAAAATLTWRNVLAWRYRRQHLERRAPRDAMLSVVADLCGLHAQVMSSAELTLWARIDDPDPGAVRRALWEERTLVKTWAMRGTLHLLPAAELPLWVAARGVVKPGHERPVWLRAFGLTRGEAEAMLAAIPPALDGRILTREELAEAVAELSGIGHLSEKLRDGFGTLLKPAAARGDLCFAPNLGPNVRFARPDQWLGTWEPVATEDAIRAVIRRYLATYGPATREEFARWFGLTSPAQAGTLIERLGEEVVPVDVEGTRAWLLAEHAAAATAAEPMRVARLLPAFDQYVVAAPRDQEAVLPARAKGLVYRPQGWLSPVLTVDGRMAAVWRHERAGDRLAVRIEPFADVPTWARRGAEEDAERLGRVLGLRAQVTWAA